MPDQELVDRTGDRATKFVVCANCGLGTTIIKKSRAKVVSDTVSANLAIDQSTGLPNHRRPPITTVEESTHHFLSQHPRPAPEGLVNGLPSDLEEAWAETRLCFAAGAFTAAVVMCRKIVCYLARDHANSDDTSSFEQCVNALKSKGVLPKPHAESLRRLAVKRGATAAHDLNPIARTEAAQTVKLTFRTLQNLYDYEPAIEPEE